MHSSQLRSRMTAERVKAVVDSGDLVLREDLEEDSSPLDFLASVANEFTGTNKRVLAVGHNPFMSELGALVLVGPKSRMLDVYFKTGTLLGVESAGAGVLWNLRFFINPKAMTGIYEAYSDRD